MTSTEYIQKMVSINDYIYVDTSALMDVDWLRLFAEKAEPVFMAAGKRITISPAVRSELIRHHDSSDPEKRCRAQTALSLLAEHKELFQATGGQLDDEEIAEAFADMELLATLMMNRRGNRQLLISNDRNLSKDAYGLNEQQSCQGGRISVCYINRFGELQMCDCVTVSHPSGSLSTEQAEKPESTADSEKHPDTFEEVNLSKPEAAEPSGKDNGKPTKGKNGTIRWILTFGGGAASGYAFGINRKKIVSLLERSFLNFFIRGRK